MFPLACCLSPTKRPGPLNHQKLSASSRPRIPILISNKADLVDVKVNLGKLCIHKPPSSLALPPLSQSFPADRACILGLSEQKETTLFLQYFGTELHQLYSSSLSPGAEGYGTQNFQAPIITRARHRVHPESACAFIQAFLECRMFTLSSFFRRRLIVFVCSSRGYRSR